MTPRLRWAQKGIWWIKEILREVERYQHSGQVCWFASIQFRANLLICEHSEQACWFVNIQGKFLELLKIQNTLVELSIIQGMFFDLSTLFRASLLIWQHSGYKIVWLIIDLILNKPFLPNAGGKHWFYTLFNTESEAKTTFCHQHGLEMVN